jgi:hypothetical protein
MPNSKITLMSFDIGIKNMAYCLISLDTIEKRLTILGWNVLCLLEEPEIEVYCTIMDETKKKGVKTPKCCSKKAKYKKGGEYYCEKHAKVGTGGYIIPKDYYLPKSLQKMKVGDLANMANTYEIGINRDRPTKKAIIEKLVDYFAIRCYEPIIPKLAKTAGNTDLITIGRNMKKRLNGIFANTDILRNMTHVIMENQISPIATRMKSIQGMLAQYFIQQEDENQEYVIEHVSSSNKLKLFDGDSNRTNGHILENTVITNTIESMDKKKYKENKNRGVDYTRIIMNKNKVFELWQPQFEKCRKKDDLADCLLQGLWYMKSRGVLDILETGEIII